MRRWLPCGWIVVTLGCSSASDKLPGARSLQPPPVQQAAIVENLPLDGSVSRERAALLTVQLVAIPVDETDTETYQLLGDGTLYQLQLDRLGDKGATLVRFDDAAVGNPVATRIPLVAP